MSTGSSRPPGEWFTPRVLRGLRWGATACWIAAFAASIVIDGVPFWRSDLLLWLGLGVLATSIGKRNLFTVVIDFVPFAAVLIVYDYLRGVSDTLGMPTWWHPQIDIDKFLFFGHEPTVWLQEHLREADTRWWDVVVALCYMSFFFLPYVTAAVLWLRSRADFYRWSLRFVALSFVSFALFALIPAAPPWAAAACSAAQVADHPRNPPCMAGPGRADGGLLGLMTDQRPGTNPWVVHGGATRGLLDLHLRFAAQLIDAGRIGVDEVAAVPSLHAGAILLFSIFFWNRVHRWWRPVLVAYPLLMAFSLVYGAEHYVTDVLAGWVCAGAVHLGAARVERRRMRHGSADTLKRSDPMTVETVCPPTEPAPLAMTPSSISANDAASSSPRARSTAAPARPGTTGRSASS